MADQPYSAYVVSHTHWDREWYRTYEVFRMRLVALVDELLDLLDRDPRYGPFYLDGQIRPVEDYVEIRPDQSDRLRAAFASGRLYAGPWYVQPDEFLVSGEAIIRNLALGRSAGTLWNTDAAIGYAPDAFGHIAQMPQILRGFGIDNAVLFRGITTDQVPAEFAWRSPDGSEVLCAKMPDNSAYSNWFYRLRQTLADTDRGVPLDRTRVVEEVGALLEDSVRERPTSANLLWMDGVDHIYPQPRTPDVIAIVNEELGARVRARASNLRAYIEAVRDARPGLPVVTGELRVANRAWSLQALLTHVASSRIHLKQRNHACETLLERWVEPWSAIAWACGAPVRPDAPAFLRHAWRTLLLNHPHDSICGCSVDQVHRDMLPRFDQVEQIGEALVRDALESVAGVVDTSFGRRGDDDPEPIGALVVFNPLAWPRVGEPVSVVVAVPAGIEAETIGIWRNGCEVDADVVPISPGHTLTQAAHDIPVGHAWKRYRVTFRADVPAFGVAVHHLAPKVAAVPPPAEAVAVGDDWVANDRIRLTVAPNGSLTLRDLQTGRTYAGLGAFEDGGDVGDGYNFTPPADDRVFRSTDGAPDGPETEIGLRRRGRDAAVVVEHRWYLPAGKSGSGRDTESQVLVGVRLEATVRPGSPRVDLDVTVTNSARDHRLRVLFPSGARGADEYRVEQAFGYVVRPVRLPDSAGWREKQPATGPQKAWVHVADACQGLAVLNVGLPECEVMDDVDRTIAITLLRCTGQGVGLPEEQTDGQMIGRHSFRLAVLPCSGGAPQTEVWRQAHALNVPMRAIQTGLHAGRVGDGHSFVTVAPDTLVVSALKRSESGESVVLRAYSVDDEPVESEIGLHWPDAQGTGRPVWAGDPAARPGLRRARLDEEAIAPSMMVLPHEIATFMADGPDTGR